MTKNEESLNRLSSKIEKLQESQNLFQDEINHLKRELSILKANLLKEETLKQEIPDEKKATKKVYKEENLDIPKVTNLVSQENVKENIDVDYFQTKLDKLNQEKLPTKISKPKGIDINLEKFIGENLLSKLGILITIIGVIIGVKYSIENNLVSPLTRIILGYITGFSLLAVGFKLKTKYLNYSSVLVSGAMAIMYFITFSAYSFYGIFTQPIAFAIMVLFTIFTVIAAINYNKEIIATIGMVGAYSIPFLLSTGSGDVFTLFSYIAIINIGILAIAVKKYWKFTYYFSFAVTWIIYIFWFLSEYEFENHFSIASGFLIVFFIIFYCTFIAYKLLNAKKVERVDLLLLLINAFLFFGLGYTLLAEHSVLKDYLGLFTLINAAVHFVVSAFIFKTKNADENLFYIIIGLVLVFITSAIPIQLDGNWVTLLWISEAAVLFWLANSKRVELYKYIAYSLMVLALLSLFQDWSIAYDKHNLIYTANKFPSFFNIHFLSSVLFILILSGIAYLNKRLKSNTTNNSEIGFTNIFQQSITIAILALTFFAIGLELDHYLNLMFEKTKIEVSELDTVYNKDLLKFKSIWLINYGLVFVTLLQFFNLYRLRSKKFGMAIAAASLFFLLLFLTQGQLLLSELRESYLSNSLAEYYKVGKFNLVIRYICYVIAAVCLFSIFKIVKSKLFENDYRKYFDVIFHTIIIWVSTSELIHFMELANTTNSYKLGLSIFYGIYALGLVVYGIFKNKAHLRIGAMVLFGLTLLKLFFYDIAHLNTISKTIVFVSLGILLLMISFLYTKYTKKITDEG